MKNYAKVTGFIFLLLFFASLPSHALAEDSSSTAVSGNISNRMNNGSNGIIHIKDMPSRLKAGKVTVQDKSRLRLNVNDDQTAMVDPKTIRLPLARVNNGTPEMYGGLTKGTPHLFDELNKAIQNNNGNANLGNLSTAISFNEIAARQFLGIDNPNFTDITQYTGFIPNGRGHMQSDRQNNIFAIYYVQPKLPSFATGSTTVSPGGSLTCTGNELLLYQYYDPQTGLYIQIDLYPGGIGNIFSGEMGNVLGGLVGRITGENNAENTNSLYNASIVGTAEETKTVSEAANANTPVAALAEEEGSADDEEEDLPADAVPATTAANPVSSLFGGLTGSNGTGGLGDLLGGGLTGSGSSGMPAWVGWNGRTFGVHLGQRPATGTGSQSSPSSGLTGGTGGLGNLLGGLTGGNGAPVRTGANTGVGLLGPQIGGIPIFGNMFGGLTGNGSASGLGNLFGGFGGLATNNGGTSTGSGSTSSQTPAANNTTSASSGAGGISSLFGGLLGGGSTDSVLSGVTPGNGGLTDVISGVLIDPPDTSDQPQSSSAEKADQMALMEASTIRLPLGRVTGGSPQTYGGVTAGTPEIFDGMISNQGSSSWGNAFSFGFGPFDQYELYGKNYVGEDRGGTPLTLNDLAVWQFFGIKDAGFQDILLERTSNDRGLTHAQWSEQYRVYAQYVITYMPDHAGLDYSDGVIQCIGRNLIAYIYFHPQSTLLVEICVWNNCPFDLTPGGSTGNSAITSSITGLLGGLTGGSGTSGAGGLGSLLGGLTGSGTTTATVSGNTTADSGLGPQWQETPAYGTELEALAEWQESTSASADNTIDFGSLLGPPTTDSATGNTGNMSSALTGNDATNEMSNLSDGLTGGNGWGGWEGAVVNFGGGTQRIGIGNAPADDILETAFQGDPDGNLFAPDNDIWKKTGAPEPTLAICLMARKTPQGAIGKRQLIMFGRRMSQVDSFSDWQEGFYYWDLSNNITIDRGKLRVRGGANTCSPDTLEIRALSNELARRFGLEHIK